MEPAGRLALHFGRGPSTSGAGLSPNSHAWAWRTLSPLGRGGEKGLFEAPVALQRGKVTGRIIREADTGRRMCWRGRGDAGQCGVGPPGGR